MQCCFDALSTLVQNAEVDADWLPASSGKFGIWSFQGGNTPPYAHAQLKALGQGAVGAIPVKASQGSGHASLLYIYSLGFHDCIKTYFDCSAVGWGLKHNDYAWENFSIQL
jgi:hypothetical protein